MFNTVRYRKEFKHVTLTGRINSDYFTLPHISVGWGDWKGISFCGLIFEFAIHIND